MGTVIEFNGVKIRVQGQEHPPPHCHIFAGGASARYDFKNMRWMNAKGFTKSAMANIEKMIERDVKYLFAEWERLNG